MLLHYYVKKIFARKYCTLVLLQKVEAMLGLLGGSEGAWEREAPIIVVGAFLHQVGNCLVFYACNTNVATH